MEHATADGTALLWFLGWCIALAVLFGGALQLPLQTRLSKLKSAAYSSVLVVAAVLVAVLANAALVLHDVHIDLTREKIFTPSQQAMRVVESLQQPVRLTYFYRGQDPEGRRVREVLELMGRRNRLLEVRTSDPDREPALARDYGIRLYNAGVLEAGGRKLLIQSVDESEIAIGIQRVLREKVITACFAEGHGELPMDNYEFHTHLEGLADHSHGDASSKVVQTQGHGIGRLRRALEAQGYETRRLVLPTMTAIPADCQVVLLANPRTTFLPAESAALEAYLEQGGSLLAMLDLGFTPDPRLTALLHQLGIRLPQQAVVDPLSHYSTDAEMVAITNYPAHPITRNLSMTFFPGVRPLEPMPPAPGVSQTVLFSSSRDSFLRAVHPVAVREIEASPAAFRDSRQSAPSALAVATEGRLKGAKDGAPAFRAVVIGDGDFASNSFLPYLSNSDFTLSAVRWLVREERLSPVASRIPVPTMIHLSNGQMKAVFLLIEVLLPLGVAALGALVWWRRR